MLAPGLPDEEILGCRLSIQLPSLPCALNSHVCFQTTEWNWRGPGLLLAPPLTPCTKPPAPQRAGTAFYSL